MQEKLFSLTLLPAHLSFNELAFTNYAYISPSNYSTFYQANQMNKPVYVSIDNFIFIVETDQKVEENQIALGRLTRAYMELNFTDPATVSLFQPKTETRLGHLLVEVVLGKVINHKRLEVEETILDQMFRRAFKDHFLNQKQTVLIDFQKSILILNILESSNLDGNEQTPGILLEETILEFKYQSNEYLAFKKSFSKTGSQNLERED